MSTPSPPAQTLPDPVSGRELFITVIVPVRNEVGFIDKTLDGLIRQNYPQAALEIIVVDGESTDDTVTIVRKYAERDPRVRLLHNPKRWASSARNLGIKAAQGDVVLVVDGHCQFEHDKYLRNLSDCFVRTGVDCLGRPQPLNVDDGNLLQKAIAAARASRLGHHPDSFIYSDQELFVPAHSVGVAYRRDVFEKVGCFDESFDACEDVEFNHRVDKAGLRCLLAPSIQLTYHPRSSMRSLFQQMKRYGRGRMRLFRKHRDTFSWKSFIPAFFVFFLCAGAALATLWQPFAWTYFAIVGLYVAIVLGFSMWLALEERNMALPLLVPWVFFAVHLGAGYGSLQELFFGSNKPSNSLDR